jgi:predicted DNA-binding WGR domain protein
MVFLTRIDPARKLQRFWLANVTPTMFGEWSLLREWGRIGSPGTVQSRTFEREDDARRAEQQGIRRRARRGYQPTLDVVASWHEVIAAGANIHPASYRAQIKYKPARDRDFLRRAHSDLFSTSENLS